MPLKCRVKILRTQSASRQKYNQNALRNNGCAPFHGVIQRLAGGRHISGSLDRQPRRGRRGPRPVRASP